MLIYMQIVFANLAFYEKRFRNLLFLINSYLLQNSNIQYQM